MISRLKQNIIKITKIYYAGGLAASERPMMRQKWARWSCQFRSSRARCASIQTRSSKRTSMHIFGFSIWLVLRKRQWVSHRYGLFRRRLEKKEKEQREELRTAKKGNGVERQVSSGMRSVDAERGVPL